jgi:hypothetical protein
MLPRPAGRAPVFLRTPLFERHWYDRKVIGNVQGKELARILSILSVKVNYVIPNCQRLKLNIDSVVYCRRINAGWHTSE